MKEIFSLIGITMWVSGMVIASGFWSTFFAVIIPLYSWYLVIEHFLIKYSLL
jgi:hypothetical protein